MKKTLMISFFVLGFTSLVAQLVIIREAMVSFYGNELFIGLVLGLWLIWVAFGSLTLARIFLKQSSLKILVGCHFLAPFFFLVEVFFLRLARLVLVNPGQTPDLLLSLGYLILVTAPLCWLLGLQFALASRTLVSMPELRPSIFSRFFLWLKKVFSAKSKVDITLLVSQGYFYETIGLVFGGLFYYFVLVFLDSLNLFLLLATLNFLVSVILVQSKKIRWSLIGLLILIVGGARLAPDFFSNLERLTQNWRFANQTLISTKNSPFGSIAITQIGNEYNFYESGLLVGSTQPNFINEEIIHFPLLYQEKPEKVLLIGGGFSGALAEILKYPVKKVYYVELDPLLFTTFKPYLIKDSSFVTKNDKVSLVYNDPFYFIKTTKEKFDVIIVDLPGPSTALLNRFYTVEFFQVAKNKLNNDGILLIYLSSSANYLSPPLENLATLIYQSLGSSFSSVKVLPEDNILYLASDKNLDDKISTLEKRFDNYNLKNKLVTKDYLRYRLTNDRINQTLALFERNKSLEINTDNRPIGYFYQNLFWLSFQHPKLVDFLAFFKNITLTKLIIGSLILFFALYYVLDVLVKRRERILVVVTMIPDFSLISAEVAFIFFFQATYGYLYYQLSLIFTALILGIAFGTYLANILVAKNKVKYCYLFRLYFFFGLYFVFIVLLLKSFPQALETPIFFYWLVFTTGLLGGMEFPMVNKYYLQDKIEPAKKTSTIYGADLIGSGLGAIITSIFLLPVLGFSKTIIFLAVLNFFAFAILFFLRQNFEDS